MLSYRLSSAALAAALLLSAAACSGADDPPPLFPDDYADTYEEVRDCRTSSDHSLNKIRVLADPDSFGPYMDRDRPFPLGSVILKEEYDLADTDCSGELLQWSVMVKVEDGSAPDLVDFDWQRVRADRSVASQNDRSCANCHMACTCESLEDPDPACQPTEGYAFTCAHE